MEMLTKTFVCRNPESEFLDETCASGIYIVTFGHLPCWRGEYGWSSSGDAWRMPPNLFERTFPSGRMNPAGGPTEAVVTLRRRRASRPADIFMCRDKAYSTDYVVYFGPMPDDARGEALWRRWNNSRADNVGWVISPRNVERFFPTAKLEPGGGPLGVTAAMRKPRYSPVVVELDSGAT